MTCAWWQRWFHRRQRRADLWLYAHLANTAPSLAHARVAWEAFLSGPGAEHWHCDCAMEVSAALRAVMFRADAASQEAPPP